MSEDSKIELNRRRVLGGIVAVGGAAAAAGAGTFALFSDTESSSGNTIQAGTLDLGNVTGDTISATEITPGWTSNTNNIETDYSATTGVTASIRLDISLQNNDAESTPVNSGEDLDATGFAEKIRVDTADLSDGDTSNNLLDDITGTEKQLEGGAVTYPDLSQLASTYNQSSNILSSVDPGDTVMLTLELSMPTQVGNDAQGEGVDIDVTFEAVQN